MLGHESSFSYESSLSEISAESDTYVCLHTQRPPPRGLPHKPASANTQISAAENVLEIYCRVLTGGDASSADTKLAQFVSTTNFPDSSEHIKSGCSYPSRKHIALFLRPFLRRVSL